MRPGHLSITLLTLLGAAACGSTDTASSPAASGSSGVAAATCATGSITAAGSTALQPLVQAAAKLYQAKCPGATITVNGGGSSAGLQAASKGTADIGDSEVPITASKLDASTVTDHQVAIVIFAVAVNQGAGVTNLTSQQVQDLFTGKVTNWSQVGGKDVPVTLIERKPGSGTRLSFDRIMLKNGATEAANPAGTQDSTQLVLQQVGQSPGGVSYLAASSITSGGPVSAVTIDGATPDASAVSSGKYPLWSHEHMYTKASGSSALADSFVAYVAGSEFQAASVTKLGYLPISTTSAQSDADK